MSADTLTGVGGAPGIAIGPAFRYAPAATVPPDATLAEFAAACAQAAAELNALAERQHAAGHADEAGIFEFQALLAEDPDLTDTVAQLVSEGQPLAAALTAASAALEAQLQALEDPYMQQRAADVAAVTGLIRRALAGETASLAAAPPGAVVIAADLTPAETAELPAQIAGFLTADGGPNGHTAILARSRGIPAVVGAGAAALQIADGTQLVLDGAAATVYIAPDAAALAGFQRRVVDEQQARERRNQQVRVAGRLRDGRPIGLWANIGSPQEAAGALAAGAEGVGLFRTEFLFLERRAPPTEAEQLTAYQTVLTTFGGRPVVIRTIDIGGDKEVPYLNLPREPNPFLGTRGLRLCMARPDLFRTQLRALLRAAPSGDLWVMLPMVSTSADLAWGRAQLDDAAAELVAEGLEHRANVRLGVMVETPAAAVGAHQLARDAAFLSVGSNDLAQYTLAVDRGLADLAARYPADHPAVYALIGQAASAARAAGIPIGICGELGGNPDAAVILAGLGLDELSMAPASIPLVKERLAATSATEAAEAARLVWS